MNSWGRLIKQKTIEVYRYPNNGFTYNEYGELVTPTPERLEIQGSYPQRVKANKLLTLPENVQSRETIRLFTKEKLRMAREGDSGFLSDTVVHDDDEWEVVRCEPKLVGHLNHYDVIACRKQIAPDNKVTESRDAYND